MKKSVFFCIISLIAASIAPIHASLTIIENEQKFNETINADTPTVVVFSTEWCPACKHFKAPLEKVANDPAFKNITFIKVDTDKFDALANKYHVRGLPTTQFIQAGKQKKEITGAQSEKELKDHIKSAFGTISADLNLEEKKEKLQQAFHETADKTKAALEETTQNIKDAAHDMKNTIAETYQEATTTQPVESAGPFQMVWNIIASIFISIKDVIVNFFSSVISFIKNLF